MASDQDFKGISISSFINDFARVFKPGDVSKADQLGLKTVGDVLADTRERPEGVTAYRQPSIDWK